MIQRLSITLMLAAAAMAYQADNTERNKRDRDAAAATAGRQGNSKTDLELTARIRRAITADKTLSTNAHNVKIITNEGHVILRGPVSSQQEKDRVAAIARESAGTDNVTVQIEVTKEGK